MPLTAFAARRIDWKARRSLCAAGAGLLALVLSTNALQSVQANGDTRTLSFFHTHRKDAITITFKRNGRYDEAALAQLNNYLRDWRNDKEIKMDPHLFDILWEVVRDTKAQKPIHIVSSFRSPETNAMLRSRSRGVAQYSLHMQGRAIDFFLPDVELADLRAAGLRLQRGGVGFYPGSNFVHLDTGSIRHWPRMSHDQLARVFPDGKTVHLSASGPMKNFQQAAAELRRRGQLGDRDAIFPANAAPTAGDGNQLKNFIASIFGANRKQENVEVEAEADEETPPANNPQPQRNTKVASVTPQLPPAAQPKLRWNTGPNAVNEPQTTGTAAPLGYARENDRTFPPTIRPQGKLTAAPFAPGADKPNRSVTRNELIHLSGEFAAPDARKLHGFAQPAMAAVDMTFQSGARPELVTHGFQKNRPELNVVGFDAPPAQAAR